MFKLKVWMLDFKVFTKIFNLIIRKHAISEFKVTQFTMHCIHNVLGTYVDGK